MHIQAFGVCNNNDDAWHVVATSQFWIVRVKAMSVCFISQKVAIKTVFPCWIFADSQYNNACPALSAALGCAL